MGKKNQNEFNIVESILDNSKTPKGVWELAKTARVNCTYASTFARALTDNGYMEIEGHDGGSKPQFLITQKGIDYLKLLRIVTRGMEEIRKSLK